MLAQPGPQQTRPQQPRPQSGSLPNGSPLNASSLNGSALNGSALNGSALNGSALNASVPPDTVDSPTPGLLDTPEAGGEALIGIEEVQKSLNRSRASVYRYTNTDPRNLNPPFNPRKLNPEYRSDQKEPLLFHPHEVARFARDILRIKEVTVEVLNAPSTATQQLLGSILEELRAIRRHLDATVVSPADLDAHRHQLDRARPAA
jgi:hypothetical protein